MAKDLAPTKSEIEACADVAVLEEMLEDTEAVITNISTQLEHDYGDDAWAQGAIKALATHRNAKRMIEKRLKAIRSPLVVEHRLRRRPAEENSTTTNTALPLRRSFTTDMAGIETPEACEGLAARIRLAISEVEADRADELSRPPGDRDVVFLTAVAELLRAWRAQLQALQNHAGQLRRERRVQLRARQGDVLNARFVIRAREVLPRDVYLTLWEHVNAQGDPSVS